MIRRYCDICGQEIRSTLEGTYEDRFILELASPRNLAKLGGQVGDQKPMITLEVKNCNNRDICKKCLAELLHIEFSLSADGGSF